MSCDNVDTGDNHEIPGCTKPGCKTDAVALFDNGRFQEPRCDNHSSDWLTVVEKYD